MDVGDKVKLQPCPFCGGREVAVCERDHLHFVLCGNCTAEGPAMDGAQGHVDAVREWNRRTLSASIGEDGLPELPKAAHRGPDGTGSYFDSYTIDQMRQYAREAVAADRRYQSSMQKVHVPSSVATTAKSAVLRSDSCAQLAVKEPTQGDAEAEIYAIWDAAKAEAAMYVEAHCVDGELHANHIMNAGRPKVTVAPPLPSESQTMKGTTE